MWSSGIVEEVLPHEQKVDRPIFYMPHRPVVRETAVSSKVRPVFDASARGYNGVSLNDCMEVGPNLLSNLTEILLRFRRWCIGISSDVEKAFLQISVSEGDRDVHRFLWNLGGETKHLRFRRVPFGNCASPFLLNATIQHHLAKFPNSRVIEELKDNLYVDDWLTGADSAEEGCKLIQEASDVMNQAAMPLAKWVSNSPAVAEVLHRDFKDKFIDAESVKVLGMKWLATSDAFSFSIASLPDGFASQNELFWATFPDCSIRWELRIRMWWESSVYFRICGVLVFSGMMSYRPSFVFSSSGGLMAFRFYSSGQFPAVTLVLVGVTSEVWHFMLLVTRPPEGTAHVYIW